MEMGVVIPTELAADLHVSIMPDSAASDISPGGDELTGHLAVPTNVREPAGRS
jgi:hypothetical protein